MLLLCLFSGFIAAFALLKLQKHGKQGNFHVFGKMLHKKQADFLCILTVGLSRAAPIHYIYNAPRLSCPALAIKKFNRFPLCYYYIESMRFCQVFTESFTFPNMTDCTNTKRSIHSKRPGHSKHSRQPSRQVFSPSSLYSRARKLTIGTILHCVKVDSSNIHYIYVYPAVQSRISSAQKQAKAQPNRNTTNHTTGSSLGAICSTQPPANALVSAPNAHIIFTITGYLQPVQTPL